jgi:hypothetical protein
MESLFHGMESLFHGMESLFHGMESLNLKKRPWYSPQPFY